MPKLTPLREMHFVMRWEGWSCAVCGLLCLHKPAPDIIPPQGGISLKEQIPLLTADPDCIPVPLAAYLHGSSRSYGRYPVDLIAPPVFPYDLTGKQEAVLPEGGNDLNVGFFVFHFGSLSNRRVCHRHNGIMRTIVRQEPALVCNLVNMDGHRGHGA